MIHDLIALVKPAFCGLLLSLVAQASLLAQCDYAKREAATTDGVCNSNPWVLVFEDNFDGASLDLEKWQIQPHQQGPLSDASNQEYNSLDNSTVSDGFLHIAIKKESVERKAVNWMKETDLMGDSLENLRTYNFTSSVLWTNEQYSHGRFEARCKVPRGKGFWSAFWTFTSDEGRWNEIDIFEIWNVYGPKFLGIGGNYRPVKSTSRLRMNSHYDFDNNGGHHNCPKHKDMADFAAHFHKFELIWTPYTMEWRVDGARVRLKYKYTRFLGLKNVGCDDYKANKKYRIDKAFPMEPMNIIIGVGIRTGVDAPDSVYTTFPSYMEVDYIRYYKR